MKKLAILALGVLSLVACTDQKVVNYNTARLDVVEDYLRNHKYVKPSENLDKLDFYERVVRSVAREENEVSDYYEIMGEKKQRSTVMLGTAPEEAPAEQQQVEQNAAPTEAQATPETKVEEAK